MNHSRTSTARPLTIVFLVMSALALLAWSCSDGTTTTTGSATSVTTPPTTLRETSTTTDSTPDPTLMSPESKRLTDLLKAHTKLALDLGAALQKQGVAEDDPRGAMVWAVRAAGQAATVQKAVVDGQLALAEAAFVELTQHLSRAQAIAQGDVAATVKTAQDHLAAVPPPGTDPTATAAGLEAILTDLEPLVAQAKALLQSSTTTTP